MSDTAVRRYAPGRAREKELLDAAYALFAEVGFNGVSVRDIAARVGISHASVLRYYPSKDAILLALLDRWERANHDWADEHPELTYEELVVALAHRNASLPGYGELFSALAGEATPEQHPAHGHFVRRYRDLREEVSASRRDASKVVAGLWDGLQIMSLYLTEIDVAAELEAFFARDAAERRPWPDPDPGDFQLGQEPTPLGYARGRQKRAQIVEEATTLFAQRGFLATSLSEIASRVGVSKSTLLHHIGSKDSLLRSVIAERDRRIESTFAGPEFYSVDGLLDGARDNAVQSGLVELYTVLVCEAMSQGHPAHQYFEQRYRRGIIEFADLLRKHSRHVVDPVRSAAWFIALWDGLQIQWLYDPDSVSIPDELQRFIDWL